MTKLDKDSDNLSVVVNAVAKKGFFLINFSAKRCTFKKKIKLPEIGAPELDKKVISNGAKLVIGEDIPGLFRKPIEMAEDYLRFYCPKLGGSTYFCPEHLRSEALSHLNQCKREFYRHKIWLKLNYKSEVQKWADKCDLNSKLPDNFGKLILEQHFDWDYLDEQLMFHFEEINSIDKSVTSSYMSELTLDAETYLLKMLNSAKENNETPSMSHFRVKALERFKKRLETVRLLEPELGYAIHLIDNWIANHPMPFNNPSDEGRAISDYIMLLKLLSDEKSLRANYHVAKEHGNYSSISIVELKDSILTKIEI